MQMGKRKSKRLSEEEMGKRQPYGFGLGRALLSADLYRLEREDLVSSCAILMTFDRKASSTQL